MCMYGNEINLRVLIPEHLSHTGSARWDVKGIDACIANIVDALNSYGVFTESSCCGHNISDGTIKLQDGRELIIKRPLNREVEER